MPSPTRKPRGPRRAPGPPPKLEPDVADYSFDRAVICDRARTVDLLLANNFHFENNCAVLSVEGYPQRVFETVRTMLKRNPQLRLTIAGCSVNAETVRQFFPASVQDRLDVIPLISRKDMPALYAQHDIFAFPTLFEGLPVVLLEAMATGMPVVTTETCGMKDVVEDDYNGLLVKPADTAAFVAATGRLIHSAELRERLGRAAQQTMMRHTWDRVAEQLEGIFKAATP